LAFTSNPVKRNLEWKRYSSTITKVIGGTGLMANTTTPKDENLHPITSCVVPQWLMQLKILLGATQQMAQYVPYY
jgi:hypothetical protein